MNISKERALKTVKRSLAETQFRIRRELDSAVMRLNHKLHSTKTAELEENQAVLELINHELLELVEIKGIGQ